jgi:tetratricopeptide (TPR) repeat protein
MSKPSDLSLPPPSDWRIFEQRMQDLFSAEWETKAVLHAGSGQTDLGVDVYGQPKGTTEWHGVQCKFRDPLCGQRVTGSDLREAVTEAKRFEPPLARLLLATTTPRDRKLQHEARRLHEEHQQQGLFSVDVLFWPDILLLYDRHLGVFRTHYGECWCSSHPTTWEPPTWPSHYIVPGSQIFADPFVGRTEELAQIRNALKGGESVIAVCAMAGQGKSSLIGEWYRRAKSLRDRALFWCRPYQTGYTFARFLADILPYMTDGRFNPLDYPTPDAQVNLLCSVLRQRPTTVVLDGVERWLVRWMQDPDSPGDGLAEDQRAGSASALDTFLADATTWTSGSVLVLTTRALPTACEDRPVAHIGLSRGPGDTVLQGLDIPSATGLLSLLGVNATSGKALADAASRFDNHPLALRVAAALLTKQYGGDVGRLPELDVFDRDPTQRLCKLLGKATAHLAPQQADVLFATACCLVPAPLPLLSTVLGTDEATLRQRLTELSEWQMVRFTGREADLHALVRAFALRSLSQRDPATTRAAIANWFSAQPLPRRPRSLRDVTPRILATRHALEADDPLAACMYLCIMPLDEDFGSLGEWLLRYGHGTLSVDLTSAIIASAQQDGFLAQFGLDKTTAATCYTLRAMALHLTGNHAEALTDHAKAIGLWSDLDAQGTMGDRRADLATAHENRSETLRKIGRHADALVDMDAAVTLLERTADERPDCETCYLLARAYNNRGEPMRELGKPNKAIAEYDKALDICGPLVDRVGYLPARKLLAVASNNKVLTQLQLGDLVSAADSADLVVDTFHCLVTDEGREDCRIELAKAYNTRATVQMRLGNLPEALTDSDRSVSILSKLVRDETHDEFRWELAAAYGTRSSVHLSAGRFPEACADADQCIVIYEELGGQEATDEQYARLAQAYTVRGAALVKQKHADEAVAPLDTAVGLLQGLIARRGASDDYRTMSFALSVRSTAQAELNRLSEAFSDLFAAHDLVYERVAAGRLEVLPDLLDVASLVTTMSGLPGFAETAATWLNKTVGLVLELVRGGQITRTQRSDMHHSLTWLLPALYGLERSGMDPVPVMELVDELGLLGTQQG